MNINRAALKNNAKLRIRETKPSPILVGLVYVAITLGINILTNVLDGNLKLVADMWTHVLSGNTANYVPPLTTTPLFANLLIIALTLMSTIIGAGFMMYCLKICQGETAGVKNLFDGFTIFIKVIWLNFLMGFFIFLWSLLLIIPGIIAAYRYSMALYILIENPELGALECISRSKEMMLGHKWEFFVLSLSFLGWLLLCIIPFVSIWVQPYISVTNAYYYLALRDMPRPEAEFKPQF